MGFTPSRFSARTARQGVGVVAALGVAGLLVGGCASPKSEQKSGKRPAGAPPAVVFPAEQLPATWSGTFPTSAGWSERWTLRLRPDSTYFLREDHVGHGEAASDHAVDDIGRWEKATDGGPLQLRGARLRSIELEVRHSDTLRLPARDPTGPDGPRDLVRSASKELLEPTLTLVGNFRYLADAARFQDCTAGLNLPVLMEGDYVAAERAYGGASHEPAGPLLIEVEGRIVQRPGPVGGPGDYLLIEKFVSALPGDDCPSRVD